MMVEQKDLAAVLREIADLVEAGDSFEGSITWNFDTHVPPSSVRPQGTAVYALTGCYRTGNSQGQGGVVLLGETGEEEPSEGPG